MRLLDSDIVRQNILDSSVSGRRPESDCSPSRRSSGRTQVLSAELVVDPGMD